ncbi:MAG: hypothetical protein JSR53_15870, partial [Proteobacteria bacterium]|nr:hypothetical protein [Pseudomonadota bacterium]
PAPEPTNSREVFSARTFAFYAAMAGFIGQVTAALSWVATQLSSISALATIAATARNDAVTAASTATTTANTIVSNATTTATSAAASASADAAAAAAAAALSAGATKWVAGTYADGALAWSPSSRQTYRRKGSGSSATDPVGDPENWEPIARDAVGAIIAIAANTTAQRFQTYYFGGAAITLTLPAVAYAGDWVGIIPPLNATPSTQQVANNGHLLLGEAAAMVIDVRQPLRLVYASAEAGWIIAT